MNPQEERRLLIVLLTVIFLMIAGFGGVAPSRIGGPVAAGRLFSAVSPGVPFAFSVLPILPRFGVAMQVIRRARRLA